jgi:hypothetical protein
VVELFIPSSQHQATDITFEDMFGSDRAGFQDASAVRRTFEQLVGGIRRAEKIRRCPAERRDDLIDVLEAGLGE